MRFVTFVMLLTVLTRICQSQNLYKVDLFYSNVSDCSVASDSYLIRTVSTCEPNLLCQDMNGMGGHKTQCYTDWDFDPGLGVSYLEVWLSSSGENCEGDGDYVIGHSPNECSGATTTYTYMLDCENAQITICNKSSLVCTGCEVYDARRNWCQTVPEEHGFPFRTYSWTCFGYPADVNESQLWPNPSHESEQQSEDTQVDIEDPSSDSESSGVSNVALGLVALIATSVHVMIHH